MAHHVPVLAHEVRRLALNRTRALDCTAGDGGHVAVLVASGLEVLAVDRDPEAIAALHVRFSDDPVTVRHGCFGAPDVLREVRQFRPGFCLLDLGVSSRQLDNDVRGFSFRAGLPLDMRMDPHRGRSAVEWLGDASEAELAATFRVHGDERRAAALAREIVRRRHRGSIATSDDLVNAIRAVLGPRSGPSDFARLFQAVRIVINDERAELETALPAVRDALIPGGVMVVLTYHSGEDRVVKHAFRDWARACRCPPERPICGCGGPLGRVLMKKPVSPSEEEVADNPRARSAKLRAFQVSDEA